jgi:dihydroorotate dehydrogenase
MDWSSFSIGNAAGFIKGLGQQFDEMLRSAATDITVGSITVEPREGNLGLGNTYYYADGISVNALGLPNPGLLATEDIASVMASQARTYNKNLRWSVAGFTPDEYIRLALYLSPFGCIELNLGCPNVWGKDGQKPIASLKPDLIHEIIWKVGQAIPGKVRVKLSPYSDPMLLLEVADVLKKYPQFIQAVVTCNTLPNGVAMKGGRRALDTPGGYGGVAGDALHFFALGQVSQFVNALEGSGISVIGVGGVDSGERILAMREMGAVGVQSGTSFGERGGKLFSQMWQEATSLAE